MVVTAALLDVPNLLEKLLRIMHLEGCDVGVFVMDTDVSGQSLVAALVILGENPVRSLQLVQIGYSWPWDKGWNVCVMATRLWRGHISCFALPSDALHSQIITRPTA